MNFDTKAEIFESVSTPDSAGSVTLSYTSLGFVFVSGSSVSKKTILTAAREASQLEQVFNARWSRYLRAGIYLRLPDTLPGSHLEVVRADEVGRMQGFTLYTRETRLIP